MTKFKVGDKFVPRKPKGASKCFWSKPMDVYDGEILTVSHITEDGWIAPKEWSVCVFRVDWCEKVEERIPAVGKTIDWEQRRYELAKYFMASQIANPSLVRIFGEDAMKWIAEKSIQAADELIHQLKSINDEN